MRTLLTVSLLAVSSLCWSQAGISGQQAPNTNTTTFVEHTQHADYKSTAAESSLLQSGAITYAQGEQPVTDFYNQPAPTVSLGQIAREYRSGHPVQRPKITVYP